MAVYGIVLEVVSKWCQDGVKKMEEVVLLPLFVVRFALHLLYLGV